MFDISLEVEIYSLTVKLMESKSHGLDQIKDFEPELQDTIANYSMISALARPERDYKYIKYLENTYNEEKVDFVYVRVDKFENLEIENVWESLKTLSKANDEAHKQDFKLLQEMLLIYLGRGQSWQKVKKMRGWSMWMQLKMSNNALIINDLYQKLTVAKKASEISQDLLSKDGITRVEKD